MQNLHPMLHTVDASPNPSLWRKYNAHNNASEQHTRFKRIILSISRIFKYPFIEICGYALSKSE